MDDRQIALPSGVAGVGLGQPLGDGEAVAVGFQRARRVALRHQHVADLVVRHRQIALPSGVAGVGLGEALGDGPGEFVLRHCSLEVAAAKSDITKPEMCPVECPIVRPRTHKGEHSTVGCFGLGEVSGIGLEVAVPERAFDVVRVEPRRLGISLARLLRVCQLGDRAQVAECYGGDLAVLLDPGGLGLGDRL